MSIGCCALWLVKIYASFFYPVQQTYRQIKEEGQNIKLWSFFWVFYGLFALIETLSCGYISYIPLYSWIKAVFFVWLYHHKFQVRLFKLKQQGALFLGETFKPIFQQVVEKTKPITEKLAEFAK